MDIAKAKSIIQYEDYLNLHEFENKMMDGFTGIYNNRVCSVYFIDENKFNWYFIFYIKFTNTIEKIYKQVDEKIIARIINVCDTKNIEQLIPRKITKENLFQDDRENLQKLINDYFADLFFANKAIFNQNENDFESKNILINIISNDEENDTINSQSSPYTYMFENCTTLEALPAELPAYPLK